MGSSEWRCDHCCHLNPPEAWECQQCGEPNEDFESIASCGEAETDYDQDDDIDD